MSKMEERIINIEGMTCASCVSRVEKALTSLEGVESVAVNLISQNAKLIYDTSLINDKKLIKTVENAGYSTTLEYDRLAFMQNKRLIDMKRRFLASLILSIPVFVFAMGHMIPFRDWLPAFATWQQSFFIFPGMLFSNFLQLVLTIPIQFLIAYPFYKAAWKSLKGRSASMEVLVVLGTSAAFFYSLFSIVYNYFNTEYHGAVFFETAAILLTFIFLGKYLEEVTKGRTSEAIKKLIELRPDTATVIRDGKEFQIPVDDVQIDDICVLKPGDSIPVDGIVLEGESYVNESMITGESVSVFKGTNDELIGGTINENGLIKMKTTRIGADTTLNQIIKMVEEAQTSKIPIQKLADRISALFVPAVILISLVTFSIWFSLFKTGVLSINLLPDGISSIFLFAFLVSISVIVISCPCALGLATPTAIMVGTGLGAENGILIRSGEALEIARQTDVILFDKTGTITKGSPEVTDILPMKENLSVQDILRIAASLEQGSEHSIAKAILNKAEIEKIDFSNIENFKAYPGKGIEAKINGSRYLFGNQKIREMNNSQIKEETEKQMIRLEEQGKTVMTLFKENEMLGLMAIADTIKETSKEAVKKLKEMNIRVVMVSGDNYRAANAIAKEVGIEEVHAEVLPEEKVNVVKQYQEQDLKVIFVGDGINDAPALANADVGIAIGSGTDVAIEAGDVVLIKDDLRDVVTAIDLSKKTINRVKMGLFWALIYNALGIPIAAGILFLPFGFLLPAEIAGLAMALSSVSVVISALLLKRYKNPFHKSKVAS